MNPESRRIHFVDYLKVLLAMLVVTVHVTLPHGPEVWWFYKSSADIGGMLAYYQLVGPLCMSLFFLLSAAFFPASFDRKGPARFLRDRLVRLLIPLVLGFLTIIIPLHYLYHDRFRDCGADMPFWTYVKTMFFGIGGRPSMCADPYPAVWPDLKVAHLWFLQHLIAYSLIYALVRAVFRKRARAGTKPAFPKDPAIVAFIGLTALLVFAVRIRWPLEHWDGFLGVIQAEYGNFPKYAVFFAAGLAAGRFGWLQTIPPRQGVRWLLIGIALFVAALAASGRWPFILARGGFSWESLVWSAWDSAMTTALAVGLVGVFRAAVRSRRRFLDVLSANTYGVYILHVPVVVLWQFALQNWQMPVAVRVVLESALGIASAFLVSMALRLVPWVRKVI